MNSSSTPATVHNAAQTGYSQQAQTYARGRPDYPPALGLWLQESLGLSQGKQVADVGAGTGKFCPLLLATGAEVSAVEPVDAMRAEIRMRLPTVRCLAATAQATGLPTAGVDAIVCAQAFHWFASLATLDEFARVLRPSGSLGLIWNVRDESVDWVAALTAIMTPHEGDAPRFYKGDWRQVFPHPAFTELQESRFAYQHSGPPQAVIVDRVMSVSFIAALPADGQALVREQVQHLIDHHPALRGQTTVDFPYYTLAYHARRRD